MTAKTATVSQLIRCTPREAFDAFADPAKITRFWLESASAPLAQGASATWHFMVPGAADTVTVETFDPPGVLAWAWTGGGNVRLEFSAQEGGGTRASATFSIAQGDSLDDVVNTAEGFSIVLCDLKTFLESGRSANLVRSKAELIAADMRKHADCA